MGPRPWAAIGLSALLLVGCSWETVQRTSYETIESLRQQQCMDRPSDACEGGRTSYDEYQLQRRQIEQDNP